MQEYAYQMVLIDFSEMAPSSVTASTSRARVQIIHAARSFYGHLRQASQIEELT